MPTSYRIEECPNNRAGCQNTECKKEGVKILKGELRFGTWVEIQENASWKYKHWGCVTPQQFQSWNEMSDGNLDLVDGYEELSSEYQEKVARALKQGHVDDTDWKGDVEKNRPGQKGFRLTQKQREQREAEEAADGDASPPAKKPKSKKRARKDDDEDDEDSAKAKKPSKKKAKVVKEEESDNADEDDESNAKAKKPTKKRAKAVKKEESDDADDARSASQKTSRAKKVKVEENTDGDSAAPSKQAKRARTTKAPKVEHVDPTPEKVKGKESRRKKNAAPKVVDDEHDFEEREMEPPKPKGKRGRPKKT